MVSGTPTDSGPRFDSRLGAGTRLEGELEATESLLICGRFKGRIEARQHEVLVAQGAQVEADIVAGSVSVSGNVEGSVNGLKGARFTSSAVMTGKLTTSREFVVEKGALFRGQVEYRSEDKSGDS